MIWGKGFLTSSSFLHSLSFYSTKVRPFLSDIADMLNSLNNELPDDLLLEMGDPTPSTAAAAGGPNPGPAPGQQVVVPVSVG